MPAYMVRTNYLLSEAVELLGERVFGAEWLGGEVWASSLLPPDKVLAEKSTREERLKELRKQLAAYDVIVRAKGSSSQAQRSDAPLAWHIRPGFGGLTWAVTRP